jgi:hypothetical protein
MGVNRPKAFRQQLNRAHITGRSGNIRCQAGILAPGSATIAASRQIVSSLMLGDDIDC